MLLLSSLLVDVVIDVEVVFESNMVVFLICRSFPLLVWHSDARKLGLNDAVCGAEMIYHL